MSVSSLHEKFLTIPFKESYFQRAAQFIFEAVNRDVLVLSKSVVFVPSPRMQTALKEAFVSSLGGSTLLPHIRTFSVYEDDLDTVRFDEILPENILSPLGRLSVLAQLVSAKSPEKGFKQCLEEAWQLGTVFDRFSAYDVSVESLEAVLPEKMAHAWQENIAFLKIALAAYPAWLDAEDLIDSAAYKKEDMLKTFQKQVDLSTFVFAVGFNDTTPAGLSVLKEVAKHTRGHIIFAPLGLQHRRGVEEGLLPSHPYSRLEWLFQELALKSTDVKVLGQACKDIPFLLGQPLTPQDVSHVSLVAAKSAQSEAESIALIMRQALEENERCALVTSDRVLAKRVSAALGRWQITVDDSAGEPLSETLLGRFVLLGLQMILGRFNVVDTLAFLTHPLAQKKVATGLLDTYVLQGGMMRDGLYGYRRKIAESRATEEEKDAMRTLVTHLEKCALKAAVGSENTLSVHVEVLIEFLKEWSVVDSLDQHENEALMHVLQDMVNHSAHFKAQKFSGFVAVLEQLMARTTLRKRDKRQSSLAILGPMEARLQPLDRVIIGGLNEGSWPRKVKPDPWLNRTLSTDLGLLDSDAFIGLSAYDFIQLSHHPKVFWTRTCEEEGGETIPSRFLLQVQAQLAEEHWGELLMRGEIWSNWAAQCTETDTISKSHIPYVSVPVEVRPQMWSPSLLSDYMTCPYKVFLKKVLKLPENAVYAEELSAADKGQLFHDCLEAVCVQKEGFPPPYIGDWKDQESVEAHLMQIAEHAFSQEDMAAKGGLWWQKFKRISKGFAEEMAHLERMPWQIESTWKMPLVENIQLKARLDRVDKDADGRVHVLDYKTGQCPSTKDVLLGRAPQLGAEALLAKHQGFVLGGLEYWEVKGERKTNVKRKPVVKDLEAFATDSEDGLYQLAHTLSAEDFTYYPVPGSAFPEDKKKHCVSCAYAGMCRYGEWLGREEKDIK